MKKLAKKLDFGKITRGSGATLISVYISWTDRRRGPRQSSQPTDAAVRTDAAVLPKIPTDGAVLPRRGATDGL